MSRDYPAWLYFASVELDRNGLSEWDEKRLTRAWGFNDGPSRLVKVGYTCNLPARFYELRTRVNRPFLRMETLRLEHALWAELGLTAERAMHEHLHDFRVAGEWFALSNSDLAVLSRVRAHDGEGFRVLPEFESEEAAA